MSSTTVLLYSAGPAEAVVSMLQDWSGAGMIAPFIAVCDRDVVDGPIDAVQITHGLARGGSLQGFLADSGEALIRLCVLVPSFTDGQAGSIEASSENGLRRAIQMMRRVLISPLRCIIARGGDNNLQVALAREGWHNIVVSPEESSGPAQGVVPLGNDLDVLEMASHGAAAVAGLAGLWAGAEEGPLDDEQPSASGHPKLMRAQARWLDATDLESRLRDQTLRAGRVPLPRGRVQVSYIDEAEVAAEDMARTVVAKHEAEFRGSRQAAQVTEQKQIRAGEALKLFFGFLGSALRSAPGQWARKLMDSVTSRVADQFQRAIFGSDDSRYRVVVGTGWKRVPWDEVAELTDGMDRELPAELGPRAHEAAPDFSGVWRDYVDGALTLLDAGDRGTVPPIAVGTGLGVVRESRWSVPPMAENYDEIPGEIRARTGIDSLEPFNWRDQEVVAAELEAAQDDKPSLARALEDLRSWRAAARLSYAGQTGERIGGLVAGLIQEVASLTRALSATAKPSDEADLRAKQNRLANRLRIVFFIALVLLIAGAVLGYLSIIAWLTAGLIMGGVVVAWFVTSLSMFVRGQRDLFAEVNRRRTLVSQAEANFANWKAATRDLRRGVQAYEQFLQWSRALRVVVNEPFGQSEERRHVRASGLDGLPLNVRWGRCVPDEGRTEAVLANLRQRLFRPGWLGEVWDAVLADAPKRVGADSTGLGDRPEALYHQRSRVTESLLDPWVDSLSSGVGTASADRAWESLRSDDKLSEWRGAADVVSHGRRFSVDSFLNDLASDRPGAPFDSRLLGADARSRNVQNVGGPWVREAVSDSAFRVIRVEMSHAIPPEGLSVIGAPTWAQAEPGAGAAKPSDSTSVAREDQGDWLT